MTILVAVDESGGSNPVVRVGADLAMAFDDPIRILHVVPEGLSELEYDHDSSSLEPGMGREEKRASAASFAEQVVEASLVDPGNLDVEPLGRIGAPVEQILAVADDFDARFLVIGGRGRSPTGKAVFGSVTQTLLLRADQPVVTVKR